MGDERTATVLGPGEGDAFWDVDERSPPSKSPASKRGSASPSSKMLPRGGRASPLTPTRRTTKRSPCSKERSSFFSATNRPSASMPARSSTSPAASPTPFGWIRIAPVTCWSPRPSTAALIARSRSRPCPGRCHRCRRSTWRRSKPRARRTGWRSLAHRRLEDDDRGRAGPTRLTHRAPRGRPPATSARRPGSSGCCAPCQGIDAARTRP